MSATGNCIFSTMFVNWGSCRLNYSGLCGKKSLIHFLTFFISLPFALVPNLTFFVGSTFIASILMVSISKLNLSDLQVVFLMFYNFYEAAAYGTAPDTNLYLKWSRFPATVGIISYAVECVNMVMPIRHSMKKIMKFKRLFTLSTASIVIMYALFGVSGALVSLGYSSQSFLDQKPIRSSCSCTIRASRSFPTSVSHMHLQPSQLFQCTCFRFRSSPLTTLPSLVGLGQRVLKGTAGLLL